MTLCLAAVCDGGESIACVYDAQLTAYHTSGDVLKKAARVSQNWGVLFAGDDISKVGKIIERVKEGLRGEPGGPFIYDQMYRYFRDAYQAVLHEKIEAVVLAHLGLKHQEFVEKGRAKLGAAVFAECVAEAKQISVGAELLVCGFDARCMPHVFAIGEGGEDTTFHRSGLGYVGSGALVAQHMLLFHEYSRDWPASVAIYHLCAAKFMAERAQLGRKTHASLLRAKQEWITDIGTESIRALWEQEGMPRVPQNLESRIALKPVQTKPPDDRLEFQTSAM